jgi:hypothetical protein
MVITVLGRGARVTGVMVDGVIMVLVARVTGVMGGIADNTLFGKLYYNHVSIPSFSTNQAADPSCRRSLNTAFI